MESSKKSWVRYLIPGFIFQSVVIGGGYGTGAEIAQFFGVSGMKGGLLGLCVTMVIWSVIAALTFEVARLNKAYDYGSLMKTLLGNVGSYVYDLLYWLMLFIVLGVVNATAGSMMRDLLGINYWVGVAVLSAGIVYLVFKGTKAIEYVLSFWSYVLYAVYILFVVFVFAKCGDNIAQSFAEPIKDGAWLTNGLQYSFYNLVVMPLFLYTVRDCETRKESFVCGALAGVLGIIPGILLLLAMGCNLPEAVKADVPVTVIFNTLDMKWLYVIFEIVLFGTLIETGTGFVKAFTDRVEVFMKEHGKELGGNVHTWLVVGVVLVGIVISAFGLLSLIVKGYGTACWGFLLLYAVPVCTVGVYKIMKS